MNAGKKFFEDEDRLPDEACGLQVAKPIGWRSRDDEDEYEKFWRTSSIRRGLAR